MTRTFATATAIATVLIALSPAGHAGQMINVPTPQVNVAPNVLRPQVNLPAVTPRPDVSRVLRRDDAGDGAGKDERAGANDQPENTGQVAKQTVKNERTEALTDRAPVPLAFPETLVKAMDTPRFKPWDEPDAEARPAPAPTGDGDADDGNAGHLGDAGNFNTGGSSGDSLGNGNSPPFGDNDADQLRKQFRGGIGVEKAEELARLKELQELGWLKFGDGAFGGDGGCGPGVSLPAGTDLPGLGCGSGDIPEADSRPGDEGGFASGLPMDPDRGHGGYPMPSPDDGMGSNNKHPDARIGGGGGSAKGNAGAKDFGQGRTRQDNVASEEQLEAAGFDNVESSDDGDTVSGDTTNANGDPVHHKQTRRADRRVETVTKTYHDDGFTKTTCVSGDCETFYYFAEPYDAPDMTFELEQNSGGGSGGEAGQPDPRGPQTGGGAGRDCLTLGIRCDVAENESGDTWGEKMKEWARRNGGDSLTPKEIMEMVGQPVPTEAWSEGAADGTADPRGVVGLTPCLDTPDGCGAPSGASAAGAGAAVDLGETGIDGSIAGLTPPCSESPGGCAASSGNATEAAFESGTGEAAR